jgi:hypothetical protein
VTTLLALGRQRDAGTAHGTYRTRMVELDVTPQPLAVIAGHVRSLPQPSESNSE